MRDSLVLDRLIENNEMPEALEFLAKTFHFSLRRQFEAVVVGAAKKNAENKSARDAKKKGGGKSLTTESSRALGGLSVPVSPAYLTSLFLRAMRSNFLLALEMVLLICILLSFVVVVVVVVVFVAVVVVVVVVVVVSAAAAVFVVVVPFLIY
jgi:hypothetical protein